MSTISDLLTTRSNGQTVDASWFNTIKTALGYAISTGDAVLQIALTGYLYFGPTDADGSWRVGISGGNLIIQKRVASTWTDSQEFTV
jgi:hypothetical protein